MINNEIIESFMHCKYKAYQKYENKSGIKKEFELLESDLCRLYKTDFYAKIRSEIADDRFFGKCGFLKKTQIGKIRYFIEPIFQSKECNIAFDALEMSPHISSAEGISYIPISISSKERVSKFEKLSLSIRSLVLEELHEITLENAKIIYGRNLKSTKFTLQTYAKEAKKLLKELKKTVKNEEAPNFYQNNHCQICEFQESCRKILIEKDDLSLLGRMSQKEILKSNNKGIFTIDQLSYTFRPKKKRKEASNEPQRLEYALKALALREKRTYIIEVPKLPSSKVAIYLDIEGLSDENINYLIGIVIRENEGEKQFSFWANSAEDEEKIFIQFFNILSEIKDFTIYHYGMYEIRSLKRINKKFGNKFDSDINKIVKNSVNILSFFSTHIYPPTYSNKLIDVANFLGFKWSEKNASGIQSIVWRKRWELSQDSKYKDKLIKYNIEDCLALDLIKDWLESIEQKFEKGKNESFGNVKDLKKESYYKWGQKKWQLPEFEYINQCSYFDYQRTKIYLRTNRNIKKAVIKISKKNSNVNKVDKVITNQLPIKCPDCNYDKFYRLNNTTKTIFDLRFMKNGVKKWVTKLSGSKYQCQKCSQVFSFHKYGHNLTIWSMNQHLTYLISMKKIEKMILEYFNIFIHEHVLYEFRSNLVAEYKDTYGEIVKHTLNGSFIQVDETKNTGKDFSGYVWVFASMDSVFYLLKPNRKADFLKDLLNDFTGVLVSDFLPGYDSLKCLQQKCLIHLIRDMNGDLLKNQMNMEYKNVVVQFGKLLRNIIATIDQYGLKKRHLNKHKKDVERFFDKILNNDYETELALSYQKRLKRNKNRLFTFLDYDGIPWNNNNAENAIKAFAKYREYAKGLSREKGIEEYLILLSTQQTCKYRGVSFLEFLKSKEKRIGVYCKGHQ